MTTSQYGDMIVLTTGLEPQNKGRRYTDERVVAGKKEEICFIYHRLLPADHR
jgi:hypothetical protein